MRVLFTIACLVVSSPPAVAVAERWKPLPEAASAVIDPTRAKAAIPAAA